MIALGALTLVLSVCLGATLATTAHAAVSEFGGNGTHAGEFEEPQHIAVFQETGDVYFADRNNARIESFGPEGTFRFAVGWGVRDGKRQFELCTASCRAGIEGAGAGQFSSPQGVAVDNDPKSPSYGDLYVVDGNNERVQKLDPEGHFLLTFGQGVNLSTKGNVCSNAESANCGAGEFSFEPGAFAIMAGGVAVGGGNVYVGDFGRVEKFTSAGTFATEWPVGEGLAFVSSLALNESNEVYVLLEGAPGIHRYDASGTELGVPFDTGGSPRSLTLGPGGEVYVDEREDTETAQPHLVEYEPTGAELRAFDIGTDGGSRGIAYGDAIARVYVLNGSAVRLVTVPPPGPFVAPGSELVSDAKPSHAMVKAVIDAEGSATTYHFEYGETTAYGAATAPVSLSEEGGLFAAEPVSGELTSLTTNTVYHFRAVAKNAKGETTFGPDATFSTPPPVLISGESAAHVSPESARLNVEINPLGSETGFHFEYGRTSSYEQSVPAPDAAAGAAEVSAPHSIVIEHLSPDTEYHYRVVAHNRFGTVEGLDHVFRTTASAGVPQLADSRVWEMVSPPVKSADSLEAISEEGGLIQSAADGHALAYFGKGPLGSEAEPEGNEAISDSQFVATRPGPGMWETKDITTTHDRPAGFHPGKRAEYLFFSEDLSKGLVEPWGETPLSTDATERTPYVREVAGGYTPLVTAQNVPPGTKFGGTEILGGDYAGGLELVGAAPDAGSALFNSPLALTSDFTAPEGNTLRSLYRWSAGTRSLQLVSWLPGTSETPQETPAVLANDRASLGFDDVVVRHAVSSDGNRLVYETEGPTGTNLYLRDLRLGKSMQLDLNEDGSPGAGVARFQDASSDGSVVYFTDGAHLTEDATSNSNFNQGDLYRCEVREVARGLACTLKDVSVPIVPHDAADVLGNIVGTAEGGSRVYFVANGRLAPGAVSGNCRKGLGTNASSCNLYVYDAATGETRLIAVLSGSDSPDWGNNANNLMWLTARVSPNGKYVVFMSQRSLTGYDNRDARSGAPDEEVFEYDFETSRLTCVSCSRTGARPNGVFDAGVFPGLLVDRPRIWQNQWLAASVPGWTSVSAVGPPVRAAYQSRYLANDGRVFFNATDQLAPADVNGQFDVYEYEPASTGSCGASAGCVALMSSGQDGGETAFLDADSEGNNVFFLTTARLSPNDTDVANDVYDAHVCSAGTECSSPAKPKPVPCEELESCRAASPPHSVVSTPPTLGVGNLVPPAPVASAKPLTRAQRLAKALRACRKRHGKRRKLCEVSAKRHYGAKHTKAAKHAKTDSHRRNG